MRILNDINNFTLKAMTKFNKIIKFVKEHRKRGIASFTVQTTGDEFILTSRNNGERSQLRIPYK